MSRSEECEVAAHAASARVKRDFSPGWRNALIGAGYILYVIPGLLLYVVFDGQADGAEEDAADAHAQARMSCR